LSFIVIRYISEIVVELYSKDNDTLGTLSINL